MHEAAKKAAARAAADLIEEGMTIGLGTGSTAEIFIDYLIERSRKGLKIRAVSSSQRSFDKASKGGIAMADINQLTTLDVTVDGADEIDSQKRMIKGGGGALLREKIIASMSREMIVIVDSSKCVKLLGKHPLATEIVPFGFTSTIYKLHAEGYQGSLRKNVSGGLFLTDNSNYIFDVSFNNLIKDPEKEDRRIRSIPGVVETGFFLNLAGRVIVGYDDGRVEIQQ